MLFEELHKEYGIPLKHFFKYLQIRSLILYKQNNCLNNPPSPPSHPL